MWGPLAFKGRGSLQKREDSARVLGQAGRDVGKAGEGFSEEGSEQKEVI